MKTQREILDEIAETEMAQGTYDRVSLSAVSEEAAWQNAAESLPAQPEQDLDELCNCGHPAEYHSGGYGDCMTGSGCDCSGFDSEPVAPVEANEKEVQRLKEALQQSIEQRESLCAQLEESEKLLENALNNSEPVAEPKPTPSSPVDETDLCEMTDVQYEDYIYGPNRAEWPTNKAEVTGEEAFQAVENHLFSYKGNCDCRFHKAIKNNTISTSAAAELAKADDCLHALMENQASTVKDKATAAHVLVHDLAAILSNNSEIRDSYKPPDGHTFESWWATDPIWTTPTFLARLAWNAAKGQR